MTKTTERVWMGTTPTNCDLCTGFLKKQFVDGCTKFTGQWANMCISCHRAQGGLLGLGKGQKYEYRESDQKWVKIAG